MRKILLTNQEIYEEAIKYSGRSEFFNKNRKVYDLANDSILEKAYGRSKTKPLTRKEVIERASKFTRRGDFRIGDQTAYKKAISLKILDEVCVNMEPSQTEAYTDEELKIESLKYKTKSDFQDGNAGAYETARIKGILDQICSHMPEHVEMSGENSPLI